MPNLRLIFRVPADLESELRARDCEVGYNGQFARKDSAGAVARRDLARYYELLRLELRSLDLTDEEASLICDANNGIGLLVYAHEGPELGLLRASLITSVNDAVALNSYDRKHRLTEQQATALLERMWRWTPGQVLAVADAVERFWAHPETTTVQSVGLCK